MSPYTSEFFDAKSGNWIDGPRLLGERKQGWLLWRMCTSTATVYGTCKFVVLKNNDE